MLKPDLARTEQIPLPRRYKMAPSWTYLLLAVVLTVVVSAQQSTVSTDGFCGSASSVNATCQSSQWGDCCSPKGFCGSTNDYCGADCQTSFGTCFANSSMISVDGSCGGSQGRICPGSTFGNCCSANGFCGNGTIYCGTGCQDGFGDCDAGNATSSVVTSSASASAETSSA